ncbi:hypothetical protein GBA52_027489 [Prunus armeniaca]|nr:hypothetical protein GBA52_027489 [Prunus armeniaca]
MICYLDQIRNRQAPFLDCHSSHIAVKSGQPLTKIDEQSSKELEKKPKFLKNVSFQNLLWFSMEMLWIVLTVISARRLAFASKY